MILIQKGIRGLETPCARLHKAVDIGHNLRLGRDFGILSRAEIKTKEGENCRGHWAQQEVYMVR